MVFATYVIAFENITPTKLTFTPAYRSMTIAWDTYESTLATTTSLYAVYRADDATGKNAQRIAELAGDKTSFQDTSLISGKGYAYAVINGQGSDGIDSVDMSTLTWSAVQYVPVVGGKDEQGNTRPSPHIGADITAAARNQKGCNKCHVIHDSAASAENLIKTNQSAEEPNASIALCENCHMSATSTEKVYVQSALTQTVGHTIKNAKNANGTLECATCHGVHQNSKSAKGALMADTIKKFGSLTEDISIDPTAQNAQCVGCHDDENTWYTAVNESAYPDTSSPTKLTNQSQDSGLNGYPETGMYTGATVAASTTKNVHANIAAEGDYDKGDCRYCHSGHANGAKDQLLEGRGELRAMKAVGGTVSDEEKTSGAYASFCLSCHNSSNKGTPWANAKDMASVVALPAGSTEASRTAFLSSNAGHRITSTGSDLPQGSALPCYACHNSHGSKTNASNFNDELGVNLKKNDDFCYTCHVTSDGYVCEDGNAGTTVLLADAKRKTVYGLNRDGSDGAGANKLKLSDVVGHEKGSTKKCSSCHGDIHSPNTQEMVCGMDGVKCTDCHTNATTGEYPAAATYKDAVYGSTAANRWATQHTAHLIPAWKSYASNDTSSTGVYCEGCHSWGTTKLAGIAGGTLADGKSSGSTLRSAFKTYTVSNTDFMDKSSTGSDGLCFSCHTGTSLAGAPTTGTSNSLNTITPEDFASCYHNYEVTISRKAKGDGVASDLNKTFKANCSKCHNNSPLVDDPINNKDQLKMSAHYQSDMRLLAKFGIQVELSRPATHDDVLLTSCETCHGKGKANVAHGGYRAGRCFEGCHSNKQIYDVEAHKSLDWYASCQTCHALDRMTSDHPVAPDSCSTTACHKNYATHVANNVGACYSGCHAPGNILNKKRSSGSLVHTNATNFGTCSNCHTTYGTNAWRQTFNTRGMCFGCHAHQGDINGNEGKHYAGKDWYGVAEMNKSETNWTKHTNPQDSSKSYVQREYKNSVGTVIGTNIADEESTFDDMYNTTSAFEPGDGSGSTSDRAAQKALDDGMEVSGHQPNRYQDKWGSISTLKTHIVKNFSSIQCSTCHNSHATSKGVMGGHTEWILTTKALPGKTGGVASTSYTDTSGSSKTTTVYTDNTMPSEAIASDGTRLITLNDFWSRNELATPIKEKLVAYYQTTEGGALSAEDALAKYDALDYNGITAEDVAKATGTTVDEGLAAQWGKTVDIFCYRCHDEKNMANKAHQGTRTWLNEYSHKKASLACVNCHLPEIHGGKLEGLLTDRGAYDSDNDGIADANDSSSTRTPSGMTNPYSASADTHKLLNKSQEFRWTVYKQGGNVFNSVNTSPRVLGENLPAAKLFSVGPSPSGDNSWSYTGCSVDSSCHVSGLVERKFGEQTGADWLNWK